MEEPSSELKAYRKAFFEMLAIDRGEIRESLPPEEVLEVGQCWKSYAPED